MTERLNRFAWSICEILIVVINISRWRFRETRVELETFAFKQHVRCIPQRWTVSPIFLSSSWQCHRSRPNARRASHIIPMCICLFEYVVINAFDGTRCRDKQREENVLCLSYRGLSWCLCNFADHSWRPYPLRVFCWAEENNPWSRISPFLCFIRKDAEYETCLVLSSVSPSNTSRWKESYHKVRT